MRSGRYSSRSIAATPYQHSSGSCRLPGGDQQHSLLSLSDLSVRYLLPSIDRGVMLEGGDGQVTGQIVQLVRFLSNDPRALCRKMISTYRLASELMDEEEKERRQAAAQEALDRGEDRRAKTLYIEPGYS